MDWMQGSEDDFGIVSGFGWTKIVLKRCAMVIREKPLFAGAAELVVSKQAQKQWLQMRPLANNSDMAKAYGRWRIAHVKKFAEEMGLVERVPLYRALEYGCSDSFAQIWH